MKCRLETYLTGKILHTLPYILFHKIGIMSGLVMSRLKSSLRLLKDKGSWWPPQPFFIVKYFARHTRLHVCNLQTPWCVHDNFFFKCLWPYILLQLQSLSPKMFICLSLYMHSLLYFSMLKSMGCWRSLACLFCYFCYLVQKKHKKDKHNKRRHTQLNVFTDEIKTSNLNNSCSIHCGALNFGTHGEELEPILLTKCNGQQTVQYMFHIRLCVFVLLCLSLWPVCFFT